VKKARTPLALARYGIAYRAREQGAVAGKILPGEGEKRAVVDLHTMALFWQLKGFSGAGWPRTY